MFQLSKHCKHVRCDKSLQQLSVYRLQNVSRCCDAKVLRDEQTRHHFFKSKSNVRLKVASQEVQPMSHMFGWIASKMQGASAFLIAQHSFKDLQVKVGVTDVICNHVLSMMPHSLRRTSDKFRLPP